MRLPLPKITLRDYLEMDRSAEVKSEYHDGELFPVEAVSFRHSTLATRATVLFSQKLHGSECCVLVQTPRVRVSPTKFVYPDLMVVCGRPEFTDEEEDTIVNPKLIVEILSPSTAGYDYSAKFQLYRNLASFTEYLLSSKTNRKWKCSGTSRARIGCFRRTLGLTPQCR